MKWLEEIIVEKEMFDKHGHPLSNFKKLFWMNKDRLIAIAATRQYPQVNTQGFNGVYHSCATCNAYAGQEHESYCPYSDEWEGP